MKKQEFTGEPLSGTCINLRLSSLNFNRAKQKWVSGFLARFAQNPALTPCGPCQAVPNRAKSCQKKGAQAFGRTPIV